MNGEIGREEIEIGVDEYGSLYFEAGSEEAAFGFFALLLQGSEAAIAYVETHIVSYEEAGIDMAVGEGLKTNRIELIHMITDFIENCGVTEIEGRDDAAQLAIIIVDGLEDEATRQKSSDVSYGKLKHEEAKSARSRLLVCPECDASIDPSVFCDFRGPDVIRCGSCGREAPLSEFGGE